MFFTLGQNTWTSNTTSFEKKGQDTLDYVSTREQLADILIEPLGTITFERLRAQLGLEWITK
jgi:hypothetical protein